MSKVSYLVWGGDSQWLSKYYKWSEKRKIGQEGEAIFLHPLPKKKRLPAISAKSAASSSGLGKALAKATRPNITRLLIS